MNLGDTSIQTTALMALEQVEMDSQFADVHVSRGVLMPSSNTARILRSFPVRGLVFATLSTFPLGEPDSHRPPPAHWESSV